MSEPSERSRRKPPARRHAGSAVSGLIGVVLFLTPAFVLTQGLAQTSPRTVVGLELVVAILAVILLNGVFVAGETAIELVRASHVKQFATDEKKSRMLQDILLHKPVLVAACFLGSQTMRAWLVLLSVPFAMELAPWVTANVHIQDGWPSVLVAGFAVGIPVVALNVILAELVPRTYAASDPAKAALRSYGFVKVFAAVFKPVTTAFMAVGSLLTRSFGAKASFSVLNQAEEEIKERLEQAVETQEIEEEEKQMLHSVFEFGDTVAREVMTPRVDMDSVPVTDSLQDVAKIVEETGHSRLPVTEGSDDIILGIVHAKDVLSEIARKNEAAPLRAIMRPAIFVPENKNLHDLLHEMRASRAQMVIVQDEFGGTAGVVTIEDIVEEVVGEIVDEYDREEQSIVKDGDSFHIGGKLNIYDVNEEIGTDFASDEFDTIGGFVFGLFGRQPDQGDSVTADGYRFTIEETDGRRIMAIRLERLPEESPLEGLLSEPAG
ncbi:MAG: HlyC/CorC family transporter [Armatimonadetes bacterium]|nr:HlyC/CorC family transporter [Armatimonadota bacterium]